jgi:uncharacterized membrane protein YkgB
MVFTFFTFSIQKWSQYTAEMLVPLISHSPVVFWLLPAFGVRGAGVLPRDHRNDLRLSHFPWLLEPEAWHPGRAWIDRNLHRHYEHYPLSTRWLDP